MAVTNLTGYTWVGNDTVIPLMITTTFNVNFVCDNTNYTEFNFISIIDDIIENKLAYNNIDVFSDLSNTWVDNKYKTISFIGGAAVSDVMLIGWLEQNGVLTKVKDVKNLKLGSSSIKALRLGSNEIKKAYIGDTLVYNIVS